MKDPLGTFWHKILQHKFVAIFLFIGIFIALEYATYVYDPHDSIYVNIIKRTILKDSLDESRSFYESYDVPLQTDEYIMLLWLWPDIARDKERQFNTDLFYRVYADELRVRNVKVHRRVDTKEELAELVGTLGVDVFLYEFDGVPAETLTDPTDDMVLKALYCDESGYDGFDYALLGTMRDHEGGYGDTHFLLSLLFLERLGCVSPEYIADARHAVIARIIAAQESDQAFSDLYAERIVVLYWAGHGDAVRFPWIKKIVEAQRGDGGWGDIGRDNSDPHATGLSALALRYFIEDTEAQDILIQ